MSGMSFDPDSFGSPPPRRRASSSSQDEVEQWLQTMESLLSDVADDPELAEPLARLIARTKAGQQASTERTKRTLSSIDSILRPAKRPGTGAPTPSSKDTEAALLELEEAILRDALNRDRDPSEP